MTEQEMRQTPDRVNWDNISRHQTLSEDFIREFSDRVKWDYISCYQTLSEDFIREFSDRVDWDYISIRQTLSEDFIREFSDRVSWDYISYYQTLSEDFRKEFNVTIPNNNWLYTSIEEKREIILKCGLYQIEEDCVIAYKGIKKNWESRYKRGFFYELGGTYHSNADHNLNEEDSFGLSAWTLEGAKKYCSERIVKVKIPIAAIAAMVHNNGKIRATSLTVVEEV